MGRLIVLYNWLFNSRNNISLKDLIHFLLRNPAKKRAFQYIRAIKKTDAYYEISFNNINEILFCPIEMSLNSIYQVVCETFEVRDWHYYQKPMTKLKKKERVLDVGAAEGLFALSVVNDCEKLILIEPNNLFSSSLKRTFEGNLEKVEVINVAVGNKEGTISFLQESLNSRISSIEDKGSAVRLAKIDNLLPNERITFLKADVEGHELEMLKGAEQTIKRNKPKIAITSYHVENIAAEIIELIKRFVPEYKYYFVGIGPVEGKPVMIHFWIE